MTTKPEAGLPVATPVENMTEVANNALPKFVSLDELEATNVEAPGLFIERLKEKLVRRMEVILAEEQARSKIIDVAHLIDP